MSVISWNINGITLLQPCSRLPPARFLSDQPARWDTSQSSKIIYKHFFHYWLICCHQLVVWPKTKCHFSESIVRIYYHEKYLTLETDNIVFSKSIIKIVLYQCCVDQLTDSSTQCFRYRFLSSSIRFIQNKNSVWNWHCATATGWTQLNLHMQVYVAPCVHVKTHKRTLDVHALALIHSQYNTHSHPNWVNPPFILLGEGVETLVLLKWRKQTPEKAPHWEQINQWWI